jgi:hypothetical protein
MATTKVKIPRIRQATKDQWWQVFTESLWHTIEDREGLLEAGDKARELVKAARDVADAAIDEYEARWTRT